MNVSRRIIVRLMTLAPLALGAVPVPSARGEPPPAFADIRKIDVHTHVFGELPELDAYMREANIRVVNVCNRGTEGHVDVMHRIAVELYRKHPGLYPFYSTFELLRRDEPGWAQDVIRSLDETFAQGAVGVKIWKDIGLVIKDRHGKFILPDDPMFDPIYAHIAKRGKVLLAHLAEPIDAWLPLDPASLYYDNYRRSQQWYFHGKPEYPSHAAIMAARDNILKKHPSLTMVAAHFASLEHDLDGVAERLAKHPNLYVEVSARTRNLTRHPSEKVRALFLRFPDRFLYGQDGVWKPYLNPSQRTATQRQGHINWRKLNYAADFNYYVGRGEVTHSGRKVEALNLPRAVLEKFYHENAERLLKLEQAWAGSAAK